MSHNTIPEITELLTTNQVGKLYKVSPTTLYVWRQRGVGPEFVVLESGSIRYPKASVILHQQKIGAIKEGVLALRIRRKS